MVRFNVIAFTHHSIGLEEVGKFHLEEDRVLAKMQHLKEQLNLEEVMYLSTCNRVEFIFTSTNEIDATFEALFLNEFNPDWDAKHIKKLAAGAQKWNGLNAVNHLIEVACSLDSMVIGEREIISQIRKAFEFSRLNELSGDTIRIVMRQVIETAKKVYTQTDIASRPVSVVSLAYHQMKLKKLKSNARVLFIGAGITNTNMARFLKEHGFTNFTVFNRTLANAQLLAKPLKGDAYKLSDLKTFSEGFDLIVTCTSATEPIITVDLYNQLINKESKRKVIIDLAVPADLHPDVKNTFKVDHISIEFLKSISANNLSERKKELIKVRQLIYEAVEEFKEIFKLRQVEIKMRTIPERVKEIRATAMTEVFNKDLEQLDDKSKKVLDKILNYMEKKYVSVPMIVAKEILSKNSEN